MEVNKEKLTLLGWLGLEKNIDFSKVIWLGPIISVLVSVLATTAVVAVLVNFFQSIFHLGVYSNDNDGSSIRNIGLVIAALFGLPFLVWRSLIAAKQVKISDAALFNDKINDAAMALNARREVTRRLNNTVLREWEDDIVARVAAIDRLGGLVGERVDIAPRVVKLLATYIRGNFSCDDLAPSENLTKRKIPRMDLQKAISVIGSVNLEAVKVDDSNWRIDLSACNFDGVDFSSGFFRAVKFTESRFEGSFFRGGNFEGCLFHSCLLNHSDFFNANFRGAKFDYAIINKPKPVQGGMVESVNMGDLRGASFVSADISALDYIGTEEEISRTFGTADTIVSEEIGRRMPSKDLHRRAFRLLREIEKRELTESESELVSELKNTGFHNWSPYPSIDMTTNWSRSKFYEKLNMAFWPFWG